MLKTQDYLDLVERYRKEIEAFPIAYAFDNKQLKRALEKLGANDISECVTISEVGDIVLKEDGRNIEVEPVYKAIVFNQRYVFYRDKISVDFRMMYDVKPFKEEINRKEKTYSKNGKTIELYYGTLPVNKSVEKQPVAEKIIYDRIAKWKAEQMGL